RHPCGGRRRRDRGGGRRAKVTRPDEAASRIVAYLWVSVKQLSLEVVEGVLVKLELPLEGAVGQASATLEHGYRLVEDLLKGHRPPPIPMRRTEDGVEMAQAIRVLLYRT